MTNFIATRRLQSELSQPVLDVLRAINGDYAPGSLPLRTRSVTALARAVQEYYADRANTTPVKEEDQKSESWYDVFHAIFDSHGVYCVQGNCFQALEQTIVGLIAAGKLSFAPRRELAAA